MSFSDLPKKTRLIILSGALLVIAGLWYMAWKTASSQSPAEGNLPANTNTVTQEEVSDFKRVGTTVFDNPGLEPGVPYFVFEEPGSPALSKKLVFDAESLCFSPAGELPCLQMNMSLAAIFDGQRVQVEGVSRADGTLVVKKISLAQ